MIVGRLRSAKRAAVIGCRHGHNGSLRGSLARDRMTRTDSEHVTDERKAGWRRGGWLVAVVVVVGLAGCGEDIGPSPGVVEGDDTLSGSANSLVPYDIQASGTTYQAFSLYVDQGLSAWVKGRPPLGGVQQGYGETAPPEGYEDLAAAAAGYTYFYLTANGEHYGKLELLELKQDHQQGLTTVTFHWWLQTRAGDPDIGG